MWCDIERTHASKHGVEMRIARSVRQAVEDDLRRDFSDELREIARLIREDKKETAREELVKIVLEARELVEKPVGYIGMQAAAMDARPRATRRAPLTKSHGKRGRYPKCFREALTLFAFVAPDEYDVFGIIMRIRTRYKPIPWPDLTKKWNAKHPDRLMTPEKLRRYYYRYRADDDLRETFFDRAQEALKRIGWVWVERSPKDFVVGFTRAASRNEPQQPPPKADPRP
jgi:hypothetical protein